MGEPVDLTSEDLWASDDVHRTFATLRERAPVSWQRERERGGFPAGAGYWAVVRYEDVATVSLDAKRFSSEPTTSIRDLPAELAEYIGSMLNLDDPRHAKLRRIVSPAFSPRRVQQLTARIRQRADDLVAGARAAGTCDLVSSVAAPLPVQVICEMLGVPEERFPTIVGHVDLLATGEAMQMMVAGKALHDCAHDLAVERIERRGDDLLSDLVHANVDGERLTPTEVGSFFTLLVVAGMLTTRHVISHGVVALAEHREQRERWLADLDGLTATAVDELIRWATPVRHFRRTATCDTRLGEVDIARGDKVVMWYTSCNRDEARFADPHRLDVARDPNPHLSFGIGPHFCLGASLARQEIAAVFTALLEQAPGWQVTKAERLASSSADGYAEVVCRLA